MTTTPKCRMTGCDTVVAARGLCLPHYQRARDLVTSGRTSWEKLAQLGFVSVPRRAAACHDFDAALFTPEELAAARAAEERAAKRAARAAALPPPATPSCPAI